MKNYRLNLIPGDGIGVDVINEKGYAGEAAKAVRDWAFRNTDYPALYSYCKYTNVPSIKTAESIGMHFVCEYPDETNGTTHVSAVSRKEWLDEMAEIT